MELQETDYGNFSGGEKPNIRIITGVYLPT